jgi:hypothetical protein
MPRCSVALFNQLKFPPRKWAKKMRTEALAARKYSLFGPQVNRLRQLGSFSPTSLQKKYIKTHKYLH